MNAVSEQFEDRKLIACMELHTFSSTNSDFLIEFEGSMNKADTAIIYMSEKAFEIKNREKISDKTIQENFKKNNILIFRKAKQLKKFILNQNLNKSVLLLMTSGNFDGIDWNDVLD